MTQASLSTEDKCDFNIVLGLVGNSDVGKTCLIRKFTDPENFKMPSHKISTIGIDQVNMKIKINEYLVKIQIWDPAGQERFESITNTFYRGLDGVMLVFDLTKEKSYKNLTKWLSQIEQNKPCPLVIVGNKVDLENERVIYDENIEELNTNFNTQCFLTSAVSGFGVEEAFQELISSIAPLKIEQIANNLLQQPKLTSLHEKRPMKSSKTGKKCKC